MHCPMLSKCPHLKDIPNTEQHLEEIEQQLKKATSRLKHTVLKQALKFISWIKKNWKIGPFSEMITSEHLLSEIQKIRLGERHLYYL